MKKGMIGFLCLAVLAVCGGKSVCSEPLGGSRAACVSASFSDEEFEKLLALQFSDYRHMTVSAFQSKVWAMTDTPEYAALLERFFQDKTLYALRDDDETASFLFNVLAPLTAETWRSRTYSGAAESDLPFDNATLEYTFTLTILDAGALTVKDYNDTRLGVRNAMRDILKNRTEEELQNETAMLAEIQAYVDGVLRDMQTPELRVAIEYAYFPLPAKSDHHANAHGNAERRRFSNGTEEDYRSLLALKTPAYRHMTLADFNRALLAWANEDYDRMERIGEDTAWRDFRVQLTDEELSFIQWTARLSGMENGESIQSRYTGRAEEDPVCDAYLPQKTIEENGHAAWCSLYYQFSYHISDADTVTVGERDRQIEGLVDAVHAFWSSTDIQRILTMRESDIFQALEHLAAAYSTGRVSIAINEEQVHFERMDERPYAH